MKKIQVLGTGCPKCNMLAANAQAAIELANLDAEVVKVKDLNEIMGFSVMLTPALAVDGEVKITGKVPTAQEIVELIS